MDVTEEIYKTIDVMVQRHIDGQKTSPQYSGMVLGPSRGKYTVSINGSKYLVKDGVGINPQPNTQVWVCVPNNDWNQAYICAGKFDDGNYATKGDIQQLQENFQDGVDSIYDACVTKGSTPESKALSDVVQGVLNIETKGTLIEKTITQNGIYNAQDDNADGYSSVTVRVQDDYYYVEPQYIYEGTVVSGDPRTLIYIKYNLEAKERVRFRSTLNFNVGWESSQSEPDYVNVSFTYFMDDASLNSITHRYNDKGNKILTLEYLLPESDAGDHEFWVYVSLSGNGRGYIE